MTKGLDVYQARIQVESADRDRRERITADAQQREADRDQARALYVQTRQDQIAQEIRQLQAIKQLDIARVELGNYPFRNGPGSLRASLNRAHAHSDVPVPLVLVLPTEEISDPAWRTLPYAVETSLMSFQSDGLLVVRRADRWSSWPDAVLIENDLLDLPVVVVSTEVVDDRLSLKLGGCNLGGEPAVRNWHRLAWLIFPEPEYWTASRLTALEETAISGFKRPIALESSEAQRQLRLEWASRLAVLGVIAAVDAYYLLRQVGYLERVDDAAMLLRPRHCVTGFPSDASRVTRRPGLSLLTRSAKANATSRPCRSAGKCHHGAQPSRRRGLFQPCGSRNYSPILRALEGMAYRFDIGALSFKAGGNNSGSRSEGINRSHKGQ